MSEPLRRTAEILAGLKAQNEPASFQGQTGFWCQGDCVFLEAKSPMEAINKYRERLAHASIGINHNLGCHAIRLAKLNQQ